MLDVCLIFYKIFFILLSRVVESGGLINLKFSVKLDY